MTPSEVIKYAEKHGAKMIDCKFSDTETATFRYRPATNVAISPDELARRPQGNEA